MNNNPKQIEKLKTIFTHKAFIFYLVAVIVFFSLFLVNLSNISVWDETYYIQSGRNLFSGQLTDLATSPLSSLFYALTSLPFFNSPYWLLLADGLGRFLIFSLLFLVSYLIGNELKDHLHPLMLMAMLFLSPILVANYNFPSDLLFAGFSGLAFWQMLRYMKSKTIRQLWMASGFLGLAALARADGLVIFAAVTGFTLLFTLPFKQWGRALLALLIPFIVLVGGYVLIRGLVSGDFSTGLADRTYDNFEAGHETIHSKEGRVIATVEALMESRRVFGTREENDTSVFKAIANNPSVYLQRLKRYLTVAPTIFFDAYGIFTPFLLLLALRGIISLVTKKDWKLILLHLAWLSPLAAGMLNTFARIGYFIMPFFILFSLAGIGLISILERLKNHWEPFVWIGGLLAISAICWFIGKPAITYCFTFMMIALILSLLIRRCWVKDENFWKPFALLMIFLMAMVIHGKFPGVKNYKLGQSGDEAASVFMHTQLPQGTTILSGSAPAVFMSGQKLANLNGTDIPVFNNSDEFIDWARAQGFDAIYIDYLMTPYFYEMVMEQLNVNLTRVFEAENGNYQILLINPE